MRSLGYPFVFAGDEFYFLAGKQVPVDSRYADYPQTENGVGLTRLFLNEWDEVKGELPGRIDKPLKVALVTGKLGEKILKPVIKRLNLIENLQVFGVTVTNRFFGEMITFRTAGPRQDIRSTSRNYGNRHGYPAVICFARTTVFCLTV